VNRFPHTRARGFTMVELIVVMIVAGVLAALGIPRLLGDKTIEQAVFADQVISGLRRAQAIAASHRRVVCASIAAQGVTIRLNACGTAGIAMSGLDDTDYATTDSQLSATANTLFFQPDGRITTDAAGMSPVMGGSITVSSGVAGGAAPRSISVEGTTGYVE
jgi:MSHA pilin protein MshC